jgi:hypothetical protein
MTSGTPGEPEGSSQPAQPEQPAYGQPPPAQYGQPQQPPGQYGQPQQPPGQYGQPQPGAAGEYAPQQGAPGQYGPPQQGAPGQYAPQQGAPGQYAQPQQGGYQPGAPAPYTQRPVSRGVGVSGLILTALGAIGCVIAFTAVDWYKGGRSHFSDVSNVVDQADKIGFATGAAKVYFSWLAWVLLAVAVILAIIANLPTPASGAFRALGALVAAAGIGMTFWAVQFLHHRGAYSEYIKNARVGFYLTLAGFLLIGIGALIGPRRKAASETI